MVVSDSTGTVEEVMIGLYIVLGVMTVVFILFVTGFFGPPEGRA